MRRTNKCNNAPKYFEERAFQQLGHDFFTPLSAFAFK